MMELQSTPLINTGVGMGREASTAPATNDNTFQVLEGWFFNPLTLCHCCYLPFLHMPAV
jgi:hypothetical protein